MEYVHINCNRTSIFLLDLYGASLYFLLLIQILLLGTMDSFSIYLFYMLEKAKEWWNKKKSIFFMMYSFFIVTTFVEVLLTSFYEVNAFSLAPTIHSISDSGNWNDPGAWLEGRVPTVDDIVLITWDISINGNITVQGLLVDSIGSLSEANDITITGDIENLGTISWISQINLGWGIINQGSFTIGNITTYGTGSRTLDFHDTTLTGNLSLNSDISVIWDLNVTGQISFNNGNRNISLEDNHGITTGVGFYYGQATVLGGINSFLKTRGYIYAMTITGSLDYFIFDGKDGDNPDSEKYLCQSTINAKNVNLTEGSYTYLNESCFDTTLHTNIFHLFSWSTIAISNRKTLTVSWDVVNEGNISDVGSMVVGGNIENLWTWTAPTYISWSSYPGASNYNLIFTPWTSTGISTTRLLYYITDKINGQYYWQVTPDNWTAYPQRCINMGCIEGWTYIPSQPNSTPLFTVPTLQDVLKLNVYSDERLPHIFSNTSNNTSITTQSQDALDPVNLSTGDFTYNNTLLHLGGNSLDYDFTLQYRSRSVYDWPVGQNWDHNYNKKLVENTGGSVTYYDGKFGKYTFVVSGSGFAHMGGLNVDLVKSASGTYTMFFNDGTQYTFGVNNKIATLTNKYNQSLDFAYNSSGALTTVTDTLGRTITYTYDTTDHLTSVAESGGKSVTLSYYGSGETDGGLHDLKAITLKNGNDTKTISFTYYTNTGDNNLDHNIRKLIDSKNQVYVENTYDANDRVISQKYGNDVGSYVYTLADIHEDDTLTTVGTGQVIGTYVVKNRATNRNGKVTEYTYDRMGNVLSRTTDLGSGNTVTTRYTYNELGQLIEEILPNGNGTKYTYDALGNKSMIRKKADMSHADDDATDIVTTLTYNGAKNTLSSVVDPRGKITEFISDANGNIIDIVEKDMNGARLRGSHFVYDALGHLTESTDARGIVTKMTYADGRLMSKASGYGTPDVTTTSYTYDIYGNPLTVTDGRGNTTTLTHDAYDRLTKTLTPEGIMSELVYDANNNKTKSTTTIESGVQVVADTIYNLLDKPTTLTADIDVNQRATLTYAYDANENLLTTTYPNGQVEQRTYDALDRLTKKEVIGSTTHTTLYTYDANGNIITENRDGQTSTFTYDGYDRLITSLDANGTSTSIIYDQWGNIIETNQKNNTGLLLTKTVYTYDILGRVTKTSLSEDISRDTLYTYDAGDNLLTETDANGHTTTSTYDALGRLKLTTLANGLISENFYDANGNLVETQIKNGDKIITTRATYDKDNRKVATLDANGNTTRYVYNKLGQIITVTDPSGIPTYYTYDYRGKVKTETRAGKTISKSYDTMGNLTSLTDANNNTTTYTYNTNNELTQEFLPDGNKTSYTYDTRGNIHTKTDPNGTITTYTYDNLDRITRKDYALAPGVGGVTYETYVYDALGHLTATNNSDNNQTSYTYDTLGNLMSETSGGKTSTYTYDAVGNKFGIHTPNGRNLTYIYDNQNRLTSVREGTTTIASYTYDSLNLMSETLGNGVTTNYGYDSGNRLDSLQSPAQSNTLTYDANSNITSKGIESYTYDSYNQLIEAMYRNTRFGTGIQGNAYEYDLMGNRQNEQNIRIITKTNKKTGTTTEVQRNKIWNYTTNSLNQYTDILAQSGTVLISTGNTTNTGIMTNTDTTNTWTTINTGTTDTGITSTGVTSTGSVDTGTGKTYLDIVNLSETGISLSGSTSDSGMSLEPEKVVDTGSTLATLTSTGEFSTTDSTDTGSTSSGITLTLTWATDGATDTGTILIASEVLLVDSGTTTDTWTLTDTWATDIPVDTWALQWRLLYDKNGNLIGNTINNKRQFEYVYDAQNRLINVSRYNEVNQKEVLISFSYDALGRRTSKRVVNQLTEYIYSGNDVIEETQSNINATTGAKIKKESREYTYGARWTDDIVSVRFNKYTRQNKQDVLTTTGDYYYEKDHLWSVVRITSSTWVTIDEYSYTVFGKPYRKNLNWLYKPVAWANDSPIGNTRLYTGREYDKEISLYYLRARYYDAGLGRFVSRDPIGMEDDVNLYRYVKNSPIMHTDPSGLTEKPFLFTVWSFLSRGNVSANMTLSMDYILKHKENALIIYSIIYEEQSHLMPPVIEDLLWGNTYGLSQISIHPTKSDREHFGFSDLNKEDLLNPEKHIEIMNDRINTIRWVLSDNNIEITPESIWNVWNGWYQCAVPGGECSSHAIQYGKRVQEYATDSASYISLLINNYE